MIIEKGRVVAMNYVVSDAEDNIIDSSDEGEPLSYLHGFGHIVPGLEGRAERFVERFGHLRARSAREARPVALARAGFPIASKPARGRAVRGRP